MSSELGPSSRYVTGHTAEGDAVFQFEGEIAYTEVLEKSGQSAKFGVPWQTKQFPVDNSTNDDLAVLGGPLHNDNGTLIRVVHFPPHTSSPFHRTTSLDYGIVTEGELSLELDHGAERSLKSGDIVVQRATMHAWHNKSDKWARMVFVLVAAKPLVVAGRDLGDAMHREEPNGDSER